MGDFSNDWDIPERHPWRTMALIIFGLAAAAVEIVTCVGGRIP